jgi:quercetin dioxygenase-like cupin family protein
MADNDQESTDFSVDTNKTPWSFIPVPELNHQLPVKLLIEDPDTGMSVLKMKYASGFTNPWHTHNCAHGMYVLDGILNTHKGTFGPGEFVWFPEGERMFHGATEDNDVTYLFITNKAFDIHYESSQ